ncbi:MAG: glycosyltransferase family 39 protein, partial [Anaerolineae bacterium]
MRANRSDIRLALALFCLLTCLYWLTSRTHIDISDGETMYMVTESLVERGTFVLPEPEQAGDAPLTVFRARDGNQYSAYGPLQSLLAVPFYLVGSWVARAFPLPFYGYFTRFFVSLFNSPVHAATVSILYLFGIDLGYRRRTALFVALTYGLATIGWPYARTFFAESLLTWWLVLAAWAVYRYAHTERWGWMVLTGIAVGAGVATKYVMAVAGPAFALYLGLEFWRRDDWRARWRWTRRTVLAGGIPFVLIIGILMAFNYARFGNLLETGYTKEDPSGIISSLAATATPLLSLYSLFFSSGKGFFFFSPPTVLLLWGGPALIRRRRNEALLIFTIAALYPLFYSIVFGGWHGGAGWGPRYIVCITPWLLLPLGAFLERNDSSRWWRVGCATLLFILGFWVQASTLFVNFSTYLFSDVPADKQRFHPAYSALSAQWRLWPRQVTTWQKYDHDLRISDTQFYALDGGFYDVEVPEMAPFGRWMGEDGRLRIYAQPEQTLTVRTAYSRPKQAKDEAPNWSGLHFVYDGVSITSERQLIAENERETQWIETLTVAANDVHVFPGTAVLTATAWIPQESGDPRTLSIFVERIEVLSDGVPLEIQDANLPYPLPVSTAYPWSWRAMLWFYDPVNARPFDVWPWYVWTSGIPLPQARTFIIVLTLVLGSGFI